ncbi:VanZ family protein [Candidatus Woesearchaeota archaeon]|nr:VanZ family protein [Candidatus Woesearchaeota archaeon]
MAFIILYFSSLSNPPEPFMIKTPDFFKHFAEYFVFSFFVFRAFKNTRKFNSGHILYTIVFITLFAISDEVFQSFTAGRSSSLADVIVNVFSSLVFVSLKSL